MQTKGFSARQNSGNRNSLLTAGLTAGLTAAGGRPAGLAVTFCWLTALLLMATTAPLPAQAQKISVNRAINTRDLYLGDSLLYQIQIQGSDKPVEIDTSFIKDFKFTLQSGGPNNRQMISIVNGKRTESIERAYVLTYQVTPLRDGDLTIPALQIVVEGETYTAHPVPIRVRQPQETADFKLRLFLSKNKCYVGEQLVLTVRWYIGAGKSVTSVNNFRLPVLNPGQFGSIFSFRSTEAGPPQSNDVVGLQVEDEEVYARYGQETLDGRPYTTLTFTKILMPQKSGTFTLPQATLSFQCREDGAQSVWDFFGREETRYVIPSNTLSLTVKDLPGEGRPANFSGLIGQYTLEATVAPEEVRVGDPITLTVKIGGNEFLSDVKLPPLDTLANFDQGFKLTPDNPAGKISGRQKVFMHVLRAVSDKVQSVPALSLAYFDTSTGTYKTLKTAPLPLKVLPAADTSRGDAGGIITEPLQHEVETFSEGIAFNYEGLDVLTAQDYSLASLITNPLWISLLLLPMLAYLAVFILFRFGPLAAANAAQRAQRQTSLQVQKNIARLKTGSLPPQEVCDLMLDTLRSYLGMKLGLQAAALTYKDLEPALQARAAGQEQLDRLKGLFRFCEASRYAGYTAADTAVINEQIAHLQTLITDFERVLK